MRATEVGSDKAIELLFAEWLVDKEAEASDETVGFYTDLVSRLFLPFFESVDGLTTASVDDYARHRLRLVRRDTVVRELTALRSFVRCDGHPVRALFTVIWETSLRIGTLRRLKVPEHYTKGAEKQKTRQVLVITW
jgi:hypothetical protein